jgi:predicted PurR-regulated permease PerM
MTSTFIGLALGISLWLLGVNQAAMWGVTAGILNTIPYFGTIIVTSGLALASFLQFGRLEMVLAVAGVTLFVTSIDGLLLTPLLAGRFSRMNNLAVFISLLFWGWLWGPLGGAAGSPHHDGHEEHLRSHRSLATDRASPWRRKIAIVTFPP